ncbi:facilitated trehalose transporter Tret1-like [Aricia agestis]|uniref:facilitated trehalose transporter Tret1-like n=1 Tax=Aricia agestis TaxID=91739 RepID=UPI001C208F52|nr:facilitated trehalose transporter Tret1-like [Aricia agestis]
MFSPLVKQIWTIMGVLMNMLGQGFLLSYSSILLPPLQAPDSEIEIDLDTASWIASIVGVSSLPSLLMSAVLMEVYGRKFVHAVVAVPGIMGWICIYYADSASMIMIGRALTGLASNASLGAIIVGEYSSPENRGLFLNLKTTLVTIGYMMVHTLGHFYHWRTVALIATLPHTASLLITCTWPESPAWLASKAEYDKSQKSFYWLRGKNVKTINEIEDVVKAQKEKIRISSEMKALTLSEKVIEFFKKFGEKDFVKPVIIVVYGGILLEACGRHIFSAFAVQIVEEVTQNKAQSYYFTLGIDVVITTSAVISSILVKFCKRRTLLFSTGFSALFILYILCGYLYLSHWAVLYFARDEGQDVTGDRKLFELWKIPRGI